MDFKFQPPRVVAAEPFHEQDTSALANSDCLAKELESYGRWRIPNRATLFNYVESLSNEAHEWLLAFYVDSSLNLLSVETVDQGSLSEVRVDAGKIICRGRQIGAAGFILVHNHPSGDPTPSKADALATVRLHRLSKDLDLPLLDHFVVANGRMEPVGGW